MNRDELIVDIKRLLIKELDLRLEECNIKDDMPLFDDAGLGIYTSLAPTFAAAAEARYNVRIDMDGDEGKRAISSIKALADHVFKYGPTDD